jgi:hypothetical protein
MHRPAEVAVIERKAAYYLIPSYSMTKKNLSNTKSKIQTDEAKKLAPVPSLFVAFLQLSKPLKFGRYGTSFAAFVSSSLPAQWRSNVHKTVPHRMSRFTITVPFS